MEKERDRVEKLIVLQPHYYKKLLDRFSPPPFLLNMEKRFIDILKNKKMSSEQKLAMYNEILTIKGIRGISRSTGSLNTTEKTTSTARPAKARSVSFNLGDATLTPSTSRTDTADTPTEDDSAWENDKFKTVISPPEYGNKMATSTPMRPLPNIRADEEDESSAGASSTMALEKTVTPFSLPPMFPDAVSDSQVESGKVKTTKKRKGKAGSSAFPYTKDAASRKKNLSDMSGESGGSGDEKASTVSSGRNFARPCTWLSYEECCKLKRSRTK